MLTALAGECGCARLAVLGSVARREARQDSDIDLIMDARGGTSSFEFVRYEQVLGREVDLISCGGLTATLDGDVRREAVLL